MCGLHNNYRSLLTALEADLLSLSFPEINSICGECAIFQSHCHIAIMFYANCLFIIPQPFFYLPRRPGVSHRYSVEQVTLGQDLYWPNGTGTGFVLTKWYWDRICIDQIVLGQDLYWPNGTGTGFVLTKWYWDRICIGSGYDGTDLHRLQNKMTPGQDFLHLLMFCRASWYPGMSHILTRSSAIDSIYSNWQFLEMNCK